MGLLHRSAALLLLLLLTSVVAATKHSHVHLRVHHGKQLEPVPATVDGFAPVDDEPLPTNEDGETIYNLFDSPSATPHPLPVFFFHGVTSNEKSGYNYQLNLTGDGRVFVPLSFCTDVCSVSALDGQVQTAIQHVRTIAATDARFAKGYVFIGHSQGAVIARGVIEEMDDHRVRLFISLAGPHNGVFYGPQATDIVPILAFTQRLGPKMIPQSLFNFSAYSPLDFASGKFQFDFNTFFFQATALQEKLSVMNLARSPLSTQWRQANTFLPPLNGINDCTESATCEREQLRRKANFLRLTSAHFFGSPGDDVVAPWQTAVLGEYADVATSTDLLANFHLLRVLDMKLTHEYTADSYGLKSLDARSGLFVYAVPNVSHVCWLVDAVPLGRTEKCLFQPIYDQYIYPLLQTHGWGTL